MKVLMYEAKKIKTELSVKAENDVITESQGQIRRNVAEWRH